MKQKKQEDKTAKTVPLAPVLPRLVNRPGDELENARPRVPFSAADRAAFIKSGHPESHNYHNLQRTAHFTVGSGVVAGVAVAGYSFTKSRNPATAAGLGLLAGCTAMMYAYDIPGIFLGVNKIDSNKTHQAFWDFVRERRGTQ